MAKPPGYYLRFPCPECGASQKVLPAQAGTEIRCSECPAEIEVPPINQLKAMSSTPGHGKRKPALGSRSADPQEKGPPPAREVKVVRGHLVSFACPVCHTMMRASEEELGHVIMCPECFSPVTVGGEKYKKAAASAPEPISFVLEDTGEDDEYQLADADSDKPADPPAATSNNHKSDKPDEEDEYRLAEPEEPRTAARRRSRLPPVEEEFGDDPELRAAPEKRSVPTGAKRPDRRETPQPEFSPDDWQIEQRREPGQALEERLREEQEARGTNEPPEHPFISGVFSFLGYASTLPRWVGLMAGVAIIYYLTANAVYLAMEGEGGMLFYAVICAAMAATGGMMLLMVASVMVLAVVQDTAAGSEHVESWPDFVFLDWIGQAFYVINAAAFSALPGFLIGSALFDDWEAAQWAAPAISAALLFPVVLLSQLDGGSPFSILSPAVFRSMSDAPGAWIAFYAVSLSVLAATAGAVWLILMVVAWYGIAATLAIAFFAGTALLLYGRLIGRLGYFCEEQEVVAITTETEEEATANRNDSDLGL